MKIGNRNERNIEQNEAAIGIGAMIVFTALILVAAVASAVIIQTGEKLQQNAQAAGEGTKDSMGTKVFIVNAVRTGGNTVTLTVELAPGSDAVTGANVLWTGVCAGFAIVQGNMNAAAPIDAAGAAAFAVNEVYTVAIDLGANCIALDTTLYIQAGSGGMTYEVLQLAGAAAGDLVV